MADTLAPLADSEVSRATGAPDWPTFGLASDMRPFLQRARDSGEPIALATLITVEGGGPRRAGAQMVIGRHEVHGFLSGGCIESDIVCHARDCLRDGQPRRLVYGDNSPFFDIRLLCGRRIEVYLERVLPDDTAVSELLRITGLRRSALWTSNGFTRSCHETGCADGLDAGRDGDEIWKRFKPSLRLFVVGRDPAVMAIATLASQAEIDTTIVRINGPETPPPIANVGYRRTGALGALDSRTAVVVAQHDDDADYAVTAASLSSDAAYVGLMGSRRNIAVHIGRLKSQGFSQDRLARLRAPVGLPLGSHAPWEIAVSVVGELLQVFSD